VAPECDSMCALQSCKNTFICFSVSVPEWCLPFSSSAPAALIPGRAHCTSLMDGGTRAKLGEKMEKDRLRKNKVIKEDRAEWKRPIASSSDGTHSMCCQMWLTAQSERESWYLVHRQGQVLILFLILHFGESRLFTCQKA